jgi:hypothetical protein
MPVTLDGFREMALAFPEAFESEHMGHPDFRVRGGKIFATLWPKEGWGVLLLTPDQQEGFVAASPAMFVPVKGGWGLRGATHVILEKASRRTLKVALAVAWRNAAPLVRAPFRPSARS